MRYLPSAVKGSATKQGVPIASDLRVMHWAKSLRHPKSWGILVAWCDRLSNWILPLEYCIFFFKRLNLLLHFKFYLFRLYWVFIVACQLFVIVLRLLLLVVRVPGCSMWDLVPWPGIELRPPALGAWSLSHWTTREVPISGFRNQSLPRVLSCWRRC